MIIKDDNLWWCIMVNKTHDSWVCHSCPFPFPKLKILNGKGESKTDHQKPQKQNPKPKKGKARQTTRSRVGQVAGLPWHGSLLARNCHDGDVQNVGKRLRLWRRNPRSWWLSITQQSQFNISLSTLWESASNNNGISSLFTLRFSSTMWPYLYVLYALLSLGNLHSLLRKWCHWVHHTIMDNLPKTALTGMRRQWHMRRRPSTCTPNPSWYNFIASPWLFPHK